MSAAAVQKSLRSIFDLPPIEVGGAVARAGFAFQDHVGAGFCLEFALCPELEEIWFESQDDITLIRRLPEGYSVEFVQAKSNALDKLWSTSDICERKKANKIPKIGTSILERSLQYDRCEEESLFRIVTTRPPQQIFQPITFPIGSAARIAAKTELSALKDDLRDRVGDYSSPRGRTCLEWVELAIWDVRHSEEFVENSNRLLLTQFIEAEGIAALSDQVLEIYKRIVARVAECSKITSPVDREKKKIKREECLEWIKKIARESVTPAGASGRKLRDKMIVAELPSDTIDAAIEYRRAYRETVLNPQFLSVKDLRHAENDVSGLLQILKSKLDNGVIPDHGGPFHALCLEEIKRYQEQIPAETRPDLATLFGVMYNITDRCLHRFRRITA